MAGTPVFPGTSVPVQTLLDYIEAGDTVDDFLIRFRSVKREHVVAFLERAEEGSNDLSGREEPNRPFAGILLITPRERKA